MDSVSNSDTSPVRPGEILAGRYRVERVLGVGGMGVVVAARHLQLDELVAIKFLLREAMQNPDAMARFAREARAAVKIKNEHVARVLDVATLENGAPYMVMEYLQGTDLRGLLRERGALRIDEAIDFVLQASEAIAEAHSLGIVHRDLKPENLFLIHRSDGALAVKVLDFGISKVNGLDASSAGLTRHHAVLGSPLYMSPEQLASSRDVDVRTDIWSLGVVLYELLSGSPPFMAETLPQLFINITQHPPSRLSNARPDLPPRLETVIACCLEKDRQRRFANIADFALALADFAPPRSRLSIERIVYLSRASHSQPQGHAAYPLPPTEMHGNADHPSMTTSSATVTGKPVSPDGTTTRAGKTKRATMVPGVLAVTLAGVGIVGAWWMVQQRPSSSADRETPARQLATPAPSIPASTSAHGERSALPSLPPSPEKSEAGPMAAPPFSTASSSLAAPRVVGPAVLRTIGPAALASSTPRPVDTKSRPATAPSPAAPTAVIPTPTATPLRPTSDWDDQRR